MTIQAVILDIGDVLEINPRTGWPARWAERLGLDLTEFGGHFSAHALAGSTGTTSLADIEQQLATGLDLDRDALNALMDDMWAEYVGTLNQELADYFCALRPRYKTGILSNSFVGAREREEATYHFAEMCDVIVYSHEQGYLKPDPRIYHDVCAALDVHPEQAVLLDDLQANVDGAHAVGMQAVTFVSTEQAIADLDALLSEQ